MAVAQYDAISVFFTLCGIYYFLQDGKISLKVCMIFSLAVSLKLFALFPFLILLLIKEKRILQILRGFLISLVVSLLSIMIFIGNEAFRVSVLSANGNFIGSLLSRVTISGGTGDISIFMCCFFAVCIIAYYLKPKSDIQVIEGSAWLMVLLFVCFYAFVPAFPYWIILMSPYVTILLAMNKHNLRINLILELALNISIIALHSVIYSWVYLTQNSLSLLVLKKFPIPLNYDIRCVENIFERYDLFQYMPAIYAAFLTCGMALVLLNTPWKKKEEYSLQADEIIVKNSMYLVRPMIILCYCLVTIVIVYFI